MNAECINCGLLRSTCEMENGNEWTKNCKKIEGKKHEFNELVDTSYVQPPLQMQDGSIKPQEKTEIAKNANEDEEMFSGRELPEWVKPLIKKYGIDAEMVEVLEDFEETLVNSNRKTLQAFVERVKKGLHYDMSNGDIDYLLEEFLKDNK